MPIIERHNPGSFCWFELGTTDQNAAKKFYTSLFGWAVEEHPMSPGDIYTTFKLQGRPAAAAYTLRPEQRSQGVPPHWMLYIAVESADSAARRASELGGKVFAVPFDVYDLGRMAVVADPTGATFAIWQPKNHQGTGIIGVDGVASWADLNTSDTDRARRFYSDLFGWEILPDEHDSSGYLHIKNHAHFIGGIPSASQQMPGVPPHWLIYFHVSDCGRITEKAKQSGASVLFPPTALEGVGRFAILKDQQGASFALFEPEKKE